MGKGDQLRWEYLITSIQKRAVLAPSSGKIDIIEKTSRIPSLRETMKRQLIDQTIPIISGKTNSLIDKLCVQPPLKKRRLNFFSASKSSAKSAVTTLATVINRAKIVTDTNNKLKPGNLYDDYRPKICSQFINKEFSKVERETIKDFALGALTRDNISQTDNRVLHYCIKCKKAGKRKYKQKETVVHFIDCNLGTSVINKAKSISQSIDSQILNKSKHSKLDKIKSQCEKYGQATIYNDTTDLLLGIGKVQLFAKLVAKKKLLRVEKDIYELQLDLLKILRDNNRLSDTYYNRVENLIKEQDR